MEHLKFSSYKMIILNNKQRFIYLPTNNALFEIDERTERLINLKITEKNQIYEIIKNDFSKEEYEEILQQMKDGGFLIDSLQNTPDTKQMIYNKSDISALTLMMIQQCNLRCKYCYGEGGEYNHKGIMSEEIAYKAIDFLIKNTTKKDLLITFFGGEPLLNFELIVKVVNYCKIKENKNDIKFSYSITTNGILLNQKIEEFFINNHFTVQVSLDGIKDKNDLNRYYANGQGSYDSIIENTKRLRQKYPVSVRATLTSRNMDYVEIFEHLFSLGFRSIAMVPAHNLLDKTDYKKLIEETIKFNEYLLNLIKNGEINKVKKAKIQWQFLARINESGIRTFPCGVGRNFFAVDIQGDLFPCQRFVSSEYNMGSLDDGIKQQDEFMDKLFLNSNEECSQCWAKNICVGGCPNESYSMSGVIGKHSFEYCEWNKTNFESLLRIYLHLTNEEKKKLFS